MRLLEKLRSKRDEYLALAGKYSELVALVESDFGARTHRAAHGIMNGARARYDALEQLDTTVDAALEGATVRVKRAKPKRKLSKAQRAAMAKRMSRQMKKLWKDPAGRKKLLKAARRGGRRKHARPAASSTASSSTPAVVDSQ